MSLFDGMKVQPFGRRLKSVRISRNISEVEMASKLKVTLEDYVAYEDGSQEMPEFSKVRASSILKCPGLLIKNKYESGSFKGLGPYGRVKKK